MREIEGRAHFNSTLDERLTKGLAMQPQLYRLVLVLATSLLLAGCGRLDGASLDTLAENIIRYDDTFSFTNVFPLSFEEHCVGYPGTVTVNSSAVAHITEFISGPNAGNFQYRQRVEGSFFAEADDPVSYPVTYSGSYVDNSNYHLVRKNDHLSVHTLVTATGTDGSVLKFSFDYHLLIKAGEVQIDNFSVNCIR